ncbi:MAG: hypothetical protein WCD37_02885 [Chloroflexia bacterium]
MKQLYMRLDIGFATGDLSAVAAMVKRWLGQELESDDDLDLGGHFFRYFPDPLPEVGLCGVRVRQNHVEGLGWRLKHRQELLVCAEVEVCGPELLVLGRMASRAGTLWGDRASVAEYVVTRSPFDVEDPVLPRAHFVQFGPDNRPVPGYPELFCTLTFGFETEDLAVAGAIAGELLVSPPVEHESGDLGGRYVEVTGTTRTGLVRRNQISLVHWLYPRHKHHTLLLDVTWRTPNLLELGETAMHMEDGVAGRLSLIGYRVVGDLVRDRVPRLLSYEVG